MSLHLRPLHTLSTPLNKPSWHGHLLALGLLCLLTWVLHGSALQGNWRWDDGPHLFNASQYSPWSVFLDSEVTRAVSANQLAPWNIFIYQVNAALFGFNPQLYYLHHLLSLACAAWALYLLLRQWLGRWQALLPAAMLLLGAPAFQMAQQLMVGHYLDGLTFACLALWAHVHAVRRGQWRWSLLAAAFYLLSTLCKELYVPWIALMLFLPLPAGSPSVVARWRYALPALLVALGYAVVRVQVFEGAGGYTKNALESWQAVAGVLRTIARMVSEGLLGAGMLGMVATGLCLACIFASLVAQPAQRRAPMAIGLGAAITVVVFPLLFVARPGFEWTVHARILWVAWAGACVLWCLPWPQRWQRWHQGALIVFLAAVAQQAYVQRQHDRPIEALFEAHYGFALAPPPGQVLLPAESLVPGIMIDAMSAYKARQLMEPLASHAVPALARQPPASAQERARIQTWQKDCACLVPLVKLPPAEQEAALASQMRSEIFVVPLKQPLHNIANVPGGAIDAVTVEGPQMHIAGWTPTIGPGRKLAITGFTDTPEARIEPVQRPDVAHAFHRPDMLSSGFQATLTFATEQAAQAASTEFCAVAFSHLPGQEHLAVMLALPGSQRCDHALMPKATRTQGVASRYLGMP